MAELDGELPCSRLLYLPRPRMALCWACPACSSPQSSPCRVSLSYSRDGSPWHVAGRSSHGALACRRDSRATPPLSVMGSILPLDPEGIGH